MKKHFILFYFIVAAFILNGQTTIPAGYVSGTWTKAGSPYLIQGSIMVPNDSTLTIQPGVIVNFQGHYKLLVSGRLLANGIITDSITFTAANNTTGWYGIRFDNTSVNNDSSKISYCILQWGIANNGNGSDQLGGALLFNNFSKASITRSTIRNSSNYQVYCINSSPKISRCNISHSTFGGGLNLKDNSFPVLFYNTISYNKGVGIYSQTPDNNKDSITVIGNIISYNSDFAVYCPSPYKILNNTISNNNQSHSSIPGGLWCTHTGGIISNNILYGNYSGSGYGGAIFCYFAKGTISNNIIANNSADAGGGIFCTGLEANPLISNNVIVNNTARGSTGEGGGIYCVDQSNPTLVNNTISNNEAAYGGGLHCAFTCNPTLINCIIYGNSASKEGAQVHLDDETSDPGFSYCNIQGGSAAFGLNGNFFSGTYVNNITDDPKYVTPTSGNGTNYNGLTANWTLQTTSICINKGNPAGTYPTTDIAGNPRVYGAIIDIGAYELQGPIGFNDSELSYPLSVYPNPFSTYAVIKVPPQFSNVAYHIYNVYGQLIRSGSHQSGNELYIQREALPAGVYFIEFHHENNVLAKEKLGVAD